MRILMVAPTTAFVTELGTYLTLEGNRVTVVPSGNAAVALVPASTFDAVLLNFDATSSDVVETIHLMQTAWSDTPLLVLEAGQKSASSVPAGIDTMSGSSVTNVKVLCRLRAIQRRSQGYREQIIESGTLHLNRDTHEVTVDGIEVDLTEREFQVLELLLVFKGAALTKEAVLTHLYGGVDEPAAKIVDVLVCKLRRKLAQVGAEVIIKAVYNCGYTISGPSGTDTYQSPKSSSRLLST